MGPQTRTVVTVENTWHAVAKPAAGARLVPYGPFGDRLPARFTAETVDHPTVKMWLDLSFDGTGRVKVEKVTVTRTDGESVTPTDLARLAPARVIRNAMHNLVFNNPNLMGRSEGAWWLTGRDTEGSQGPPTEEELRALARMYWHEYVAWGDPRRMVMNNFGVPRSTASRWIRKARDLYDIPGAHSDDSQSEEEG